MTMIFELLDKKMESLKIAHNLINEELDYDVEIIGEGKEKRYKDPNGYDDLIELPEQLKNHFDKEGLIKQIFLNICTNQSQDF
ncbi:hypothetical protein BpHYR1_047520 [Brachionus plicatilis]|uniref:Uncharacterized protein n=1 Tax=Brachionus plicatilis TaxID=10195 RepID=A0A3M7RKG2_BRAPC|nr:hypothetical protein BpHYR1_047520 [Brachionus plicatilis]